MWNLLPAKINLSRVCFIFNHHTGPTETEDKVRREATGTSGRAESEEIASWCG